MDSEPRKSRPRHGSACEWVKGKDPTNSPLQYSTRNNKHSLFELNQTTSDGQGKATEQMWMQFHIIQRIICALSRRQIAGNCLFHGHCILVLHFTDGLLSAVVAL
ncbi:hypothetical protein J6590_031744 [Homalodisca vitripennis]|nr:hypothetical protein J6590_031744 [Homalodisca vitripennis]